MSSFENLQEKHEKLLREQNEDQDVNDDAKNYISYSLSVSSQISSPNERDQLRANLRYWAGYLYEESGVYPNIELLPASIPKIVTPFRVVLLLIIIVLLGLAGITGVDAGKYFIGSILLIASSWPLPDIIDKRWRQLGFTISGWHVLFRLLITFLAIWLMLPQIKSAVKYIIDPTINLVELTTIDREPISESINEVGLQSVFSGTYENLDSDSYIYFVIQTYTESNVFAFAKNDPKFILLSDNPQNTFDISRLELSYYQVPRGVSSGRWNTRIAFVEDMEESESNYYNVFLFVTDSDFSPDKLASIGFDDIFDSSLPNTFLVPQIVTVHR